MGAAFYPFGLPVDAARGLDPVVSVSQHCLLAVSLWTVMSLPPHPPATHDSCQVNHRHCAVD